MSIKEFIDKIKSGISWFAGYHQEQEVISTSTDSLKETLKEAVKKGEMTKQEAIEILQSANNISKSADKLVEKTNSSVELNPSDREDNMNKKIPTPSTESKSDMVKERAQDDDSRAI